MTNGTIEGPSANDVKFRAKAGEQYFLRFDISKLSGAKEATQAGAMAGAGIIGLAVSPLFFSGKDELEAMKKNLDTRVQLEVNNPGLMFVTKDFALSELPSTKLYHLKTYNTKMCDAKSK